MSTAGPPLNARRKAVGMTIETTSGTAETPSSVLANTQVLEVECNPMGFFDGGESRPVGLHGGAGPRTKTLERGQLTMKTRMRHGDATLALLQLCGFVLSGDDDEIATPYWTDFSQRETGTFRVWEGGRYKGIYGANGTAVIKPTGPGGPIDIDWDFQGVWIPPADQTQPSDPTFSTAAYRNAGMTFELASAVIPQFSEWELNIGAEVAPRQDVTVTSGLHRYQVEDGFPMLTIDPEARLVAQYNAYGIFRQGTKQAAEIVLTDGTNTTTIDLPATQVVDMSSGAREKKLLDNMTLECQKDTNGVDIKFTESTGL
jgi:hypothetical protein